MLEIRDIWPDSLVDLGGLSKHHPVIKIMKWLELYLYKRATRIISLLPRAAEYLIACGVKKSHILWVPNSVDLTPIKTLITPPPSDYFTLMYSGAHGLANDLETVLQAAKILQQQKIEKIKIYLIGEGPKKAGLMAQAQADNLQNVEFLHAVPKQEIYTVLQKADAFLMLLKKSPVFKWGISPNKLFDYLAMGRPVIFGVNTPYNPVKEVQAGISIEPSDPEALARAICHLAQLPKNTLAEMSERGRNFVIQYHDLSHLTDALEQLTLDASLSYNPNFRKKTMPDLTGMGDLNNTTKEL